MKIAKKVGVPDLYILDPALMSSKTGNLHKYVIVQQENLIVSIRSISGNEIFVKSKVQIFLQHLPN